LSPWIGFSAHMTLKPQDSSYFSWSLLTVAKQVAVVSPKLFCPHDEYKYKTGWEVHNTYFKTLVMIQLLFPTFYVRYSCRTTCNLVSVYPFTPTGRYGMFKVKAWTIPFWILSHD